MLLMNRIQQQEQQGFFPSIADINCQPYPDDLESFQRPMDYQPRVLSGTYIERKMPNQMTQPFEEIPIIDIQLSKLSDDSQYRQSNQRQQLPPYQKYFNGSSYKLIYSKNNKTPFSLNQDSAARKDINLAPIVRYNPKDYVTLKQQNLQRLQNQSQILSNSDDSLRFNSRFECGNLYCAYRSLKEANTYDCFIENDTNTSGHCQWFFFSIENMSKGVTYKFNIMNLSKKFSFFKMGMKPTLFSAEKYKKDGNGWFQKGSCIKYRASDIYDIRDGTKVKLFCCSFQLDFEHQSDYVTISPRPPYSYSRLIKQLKILKNEATSHGISWHQETICHTIGSNQIPYLTISKKHLNNNQQDEQQRSKQVQSKVIVIFARQHSGQINSSFIMEKILKALSKNQNSKIDWLLKKYQFRVFPMINVDGVIYGNSRFDLVGFDLNRCWKRPINQLHPQVFAIKRQLENLSLKSKIVCCIDLHSHSKQLNIFSYCNKNDEIQSRLYSLILSKKCPLFHFPSCTFGLSREKECTARSIIGSLIPNQFAMTIQSSSFGFKKENDAVPFSDKSYESIALSILNSLKTYFSNGKLKKCLLNEIQENLFKYRAYCRKNWQIHSGSDSQPAQDSNELEVKLKQIFPKEFISSISKKVKQISFSQKHQAILQQKQAIPDIEPMPYQLPKVDKKFKNSPKKIDPKKIAPKKIEIQILNKKNSDQQSIVEKAWRLNKFNSCRIKTQPRQRVSKVGSIQLQIVPRFNSPARSIPSNHSQFKNSMKVLYRDLRSNTVQEDYESQFRLINNTKQTGDKKVEEKIVNKLEMILKVRRRASNFKNILNRQKEAIDGLTLLNIKSDCSSSTLEAVSQSISPIITNNSKIDKLINPNQVYSRDKYVSHINFLNKFLKSNIKQTLKLEGK